MNAQKCMEKIVPVPEVVPSAVLLLRILVFQDQPSLYPWQKMSILLTQINKLVRQVSKKKTSKHCTGEGKL